MKLFLAFFLGFGLNFSLSAQFSPDIDKSYSYDQIKAFLQNGLSTNNKQLTAKAYYLLAVHEQNIAGKIENTIQYLQKSHEIFSEIKDDFHLNRTKLQLGINYNSLKIFNQSLELQQEALQYFEQKNDLFYATHAIASIAETYSLKCDLKNERIYLERATTNNQQLEDLVLAMALLNRKVVNSQRLEKYEEALLSAIQLENLALRKENKVFYTSALFFKGIQNQFLGRYDTAIENLEACLNSIKNTKHSEEAKQCYLHLSECFELKKDFKKAHSYSKLYAKATNEILENQRQTSLQRQTLEFDSNAKKMKIANLEKEKQEAQKKADEQFRIVLIITIALVLLTLAMLLGIYFYKQKNKSDKVIEKQKEELNQKTINELKQDMNLQNAQALVRGQENERERIAKDLHDSLGGMLSTVRLRFDALKPKERSEDYSKSLKMLDQTIQELRHIARNLQPEALLRFGLTKAINDLINNTHGVNMPRIDFQTYGEELNLTATQSLTLFRIVQELLHNAIKHAKASEILVQLNWDENSLMILVEDDGIGFDSNKINSGMGTQNIKTRVAYLNAHFEVQSSPNKGTSAILTAIF